MKRHITIFAFLLGAFAATAQAAATQTVFGGYQYIEDKYMGWSSAYMSLEDGGTTKQDLEEGLSVRFYAHPGKGLKVKEWGSYVGQFGSMYIQDYDKLKRIPSTDTWYDWISKPADGNGYLAVNFDYIPFEITFDRNGGEGEMAKIAGLNIISNAIKLTSCQFTRTGYEMAGWSNAVYWAAHQAAIPDSGTVKGENFWNDEVTNFNGKLIALWKPNTYTVHFEGNGATSGSMADQTFTYDEDAKELSPNAFTNENHVFAGWATNAVLGDVVYKDKEKVRNLTSEKDGTVNLFARWTPMHEVTFKEHSMFGGGVLKVDHVEDGKDAEPPSNPEHDGFKFLGWSKGITNVRQDLEVTAEYEGTPYYVVYHANDGSDRTTQQEFKHGVEKPLAGSSTFLRTGYTLKGWMLDATSTAPDYECEARVLNLTMGDLFDLYAFWEPIPYTVEFDGNGGEGTMYPLTLKYGESFMVPSNKFTKVGCEFRSWQVLVNKVVVTNYPAGVTVSNLTSKASDTVTFKADWVGRYTVAFNGNGGEGTMTNLAYETGVKYALPSNAFTKTGYGFYGWATSKADADALKKPAYTNGQTVVDLANPGETFTLFAEWTTNRYTVVFNPNGGTGTMANQLFVYDQPQRLRECTFTRGELWSFEGWTNSAAGGPLYADRAPVSNLCAEDGGTVTLDAVWHSELSDLAVALGCDNLNWNNDKFALSKWVVAEGVEFKDGTEITCVKAEGKEMAVLQSSDIITNGVLHFWWKATAPRERLALVEGSVPRTMYDLYGEGLEYEEWHETNIVITVSGKRHFEFWHDKESVCWIAKLTWVPEGSHPEPTDADKVTISSAAVSDGKFTLSFKSDERFDYNLLTNANLLIDSWGVMGTKKVGDGSILKFEPQIIEGQPQLFYRVDTIQRK